jgi:hypothetical protein
MFGQTFRILRLAANAAKMLEFWVGGSRLFPVCPRHTRPRRNRREGVAVLLVTGPTQNLCGYPASYLRLLAERRTSRVVADGDLGELRMLKFAGPDDAWRSVRRFHAPDRSAAQGAGTTSEDAAAAFGHQPPASRLTNVVGNYS